jgi:hypothetical protein
VTRLSLRSGLTHSFSIARAAFPNAQFYTNFSEKKQAEAGPVVISAIRLHLRTEYS